MCVGEVGGLLKCGGEPVSDFVVVVGSVGCEGGVEAVGWVHGCLHKGVFAGETILWVFKQAHMGH